METYAFKTSHSRKRLKALMDDIQKLEVKDDDFFGRYQNGRWVKAPMLDYHYDNAALRRVEVAAKAGDYGKAADALLAYFKTRKPKPLKRKPDTGFLPLEGKTVDWKKGDSAGAAIELARQYLPNAADLFQRRDCTARDCVDYLKGVVLLGMQLSNGYCPNSTINGLGGNWIPWHYHDAVVSLPALPELADHQRWIAATCEYLNANLKYIIQEDGSYIEHTFGYPRKILPLMLTLRDVYLEQGLTVSDRFGTDVHKMARYLMFCALPNGIGVEWGEGHMGDSRKNLARAATYFNDPELIWWATKGEKGRPPLTRDVQFPQSKVCVFRSSWKETANFLFFAPRTGGSHYQSDQNVIELYAFGRRMLRDTGMCTYSSKDPAFHWIRHMSRSQNTVEVDMKGFARYPKEAEEGPCGLSALSAPKAGFAQGWGGGYRNVRHERDLFFIHATGLCVVRDRLIPKDKKPHTYDQCWHFDPVNSFKSDANTGRVWTTNTDGPNLEILPVFPEKRQLHIREGWNMQPRAKTTYPSFRQKVAGVAEFVTVLSPTPAGIDDRECTVELIPTKAKGVRVLRITTGEGKGVLILSQGSSRINVAGIETDASCSYVQFSPDGKPVWAVRSGGEDLKVNTVLQPSERMRKLEPAPLPVDR